MKLPELKEKLKSKYIVRVVAGVLTIALVGTGIGATAVFAEKNSTAVTAEADSTTGSSKDADDIADKLMDSVSLKDNDADKDESVYLISDANGNVNKTIVVDHLKNKDKKDTLEDASNLSDIENVKGKEKFTQSGDKLTWQAGGKDIYYQGTATEEPPVTQKVTYYLDGKEISPEDLAGKSGKVKIRFDYKNTTPTSRNYFHEKFTPYFKQSISYFNGQQKSPVLTNRALCIILHLQALLSHQFQPPKRVSPPRYIPLSSARSRSDILCKCLPLYR